MINYKELVSDIIGKQGVLHSVFSSPREKSGCQKIVIRPLVIQQKMCYQVTEYKGQKTFHRNINSQECLQLIQDKLSVEFKQVLLCTRECDYHVLVNKSYEATTLKKAPTRLESPIPPTHNREKQYILEDGVVIPFLIKLGIMNAEGKVFPAKRDKFKQLNRFLEMIEDVIPSLDKTKTLKIIDFGCGKAYLTFALYHYLHILKGYFITIIGLDLKKDVVEYCQQVANDLHYTTLKFSVGDIKDYNPATAGNVDMVVTLHACDTATDAAIEKALQWNAEVILSVPCCQHELFKQISSVALNPLLKHGILKERFSALATDAARAQILEIMGYQTQVLEFIDLEHTPKNLLIRAVRRKVALKMIQKEQLLEEYKQFEKALAIKPYLATKLNLLVD